jgi:hypothetical protein
MLPFHRIRTLVAGAVLFGGALTSNLPPALADRRFLDERGDRLDIVTEEAQRYLPLVSALPVSGIIGYLQPDNWPGVSAQRRFYLAEYSLTPRVLVMGTEAEYVIAVPEASTEELPGFVLVRRFDNGIRIFRRNQ